jgi:hypothetical protein
MCSELLVGVAAGSTTGFVNGMRVGARRSPGAPRGLDSARATWHDIDNDCH